jgi:FAD/FMN-containing dehydrogenase/ketosteroid isomerase-like protein
VHDSSIRMRIAELPAAPARLEDGFFHPRTEAELVALVMLASRRRQPLRVRGSAHSIPGAIYTDARRAGRSLGIDVMLDRYTRIEIDEAHARVTVEAGCHLGADPRDPTRSATWERSLLAALDARGLALPDLGGVAHQTVSGYLMTGSSGGTTTHSIEQSVLALRLIDGHGRVHDLVRDRDELFDAALCSMGLLGVISTITLQCVPRYDIVGREDITTEDGCAFELCGGGTTGLADFLRRAEYARLMWWPQQHVERVVTWQARRMRDEDYVEATGPRSAFRPKAYSALGEGLSETFAEPASQAAQWVGGKFYDAIDRLGYAAPDAGRQAPFYTRYVLPTVLDAFVPLDGPKPQRFWDTWFHGLPMDDGMSEASLPTTFTEIWIPLDRAAEAMRALRDHFRAGGLDATGNYIFEIYAARATRGWLHPAYERDSLRIDVFWFERSRESATRFFEQFWDLLAPFDYRLHWGKHLPADRERGAAYLRTRYPRWDDFLSVRAALDPEGLFLNEHFREALGIEQPVVSPRDVTAARAPLFVDHVEKAHAYRPASNDARATLPARMQRLYEDLARDRCAALDRLGEVFADDVEFIDPFRHTHGLEGFRALFERMFRQYAHVSFESFTATGEENAFTLTYDMRMRMRVGPEFVTRMASVVVARDGKVSKLVDYYDFPSALVSPFPPAMKLYRRVTRALFL